MAISKYPKSVHDFVKENCRIYRDRELYVMVNEKFGTSFTENSLKAFRNNHKYRTGRTQGLTKEEYMQRHYPDGMYEYIRDNSWEVSSAEMARQVNERFGMNWTATGIKQFRQRHGIKSGLTGWFQKNHAPGNKGLKQEEYMSPEAIERTKATRFQKGQTPPNLLPVGSIVKTTDGYLLRKRSMEGGQWDRWEFLHRATWEEHNGPIPEGHVVSFKDSNRENCDIDNLMLITRGEAAYMNRLGLMSEDPDITETGLQLVRLKARTRSLKDEHKRTSRSDGRCSDRTRNGRMEEKTE